MDCNFFLFPFSFHLSGLTQGFEDRFAGGRLVRGLAVRLVAFGAVLGSLLLLLVAGLASVASPAVEALGDVHADVDGVVTCQGARSTTKGSAAQITLTKGKSR